MTIIKGEIESLKRIKSKLNQKGISRFNSIGAINTFIQNFENEKQKAYNETEQKLNAEIASLKIHSIELQKVHDDLKYNEENRLNNKINKLNHRCNQISLKNSNRLIKIFLSLKRMLLEWRKIKVEKNFNSIIGKKTSKALQRLIEANRKIDDYTLNREKIIYDRSVSRIKELTYIKEVVDTLYEDIAGAIGENKVVNELKLLPDKYILFNDFSINFDTPIYNRKENDKIFSIQIDHLLLTNAGIFIIETKNWSKKSIENIDLRSPIEQIRRTSYALFVMLNSNNKKSGVKLKRHHWGDKKIPIRNLIVMINSKPKEKFKYVVVKSLKELNSYVTYFEPIFDDSEVMRISEYLERFKPD
jgi:hypothetical protein